MIEAVCLGDNCIDRYVDAAPRDYIGGQAVNVAAHLRARKMRVSYAGVVGTDPAGEAILGELMLRGIDVSLVERVPGVTGVTTVSNKHGERLFLAEEYGVSAPYRPSSEAIRRAQHSDLVYLAHVADLDSVASALPSGPLLAVDMAEEACPDRIPERVDVLFVSRPGLTDHDANGEAANIAERGAQIIVVTRGAAGALALRAGEISQVPSDPTRVIDTLGAGDAFAAAFLSSLLEMTDLKRALHLGTSAGAAACRHYGSLPNVRVRLDHASESADADHLGKGGAHGAAPR